MASDEQALKRAIIGIPRVAERIAELPDAQREKALRAVELSYLQTVPEPGSAAGDAQHWVGEVMDTLRAEVADHAGDAVAPGHDSFASLERLMKLLVKAS